MATNLWVRDLAIYSYWLWHNEKMPDPKTPVFQADIAKVFGLSKARVSQIWDKIESGKMYEAEIVNTMALVDYMIEKP